MQTYSNDNTELTYENIKNALIDIKKLLPEPEVFLINNVISQKLFDSFVELANGNYMKMPQIKDYGFMINRNYFINSKYIKYGEVYKIKDKRLKDELLENVVGVAKW